MPDLLLPISAHQRPAQLMYNRGPNSGYWYEHGIGTDGASTRWRATRWRTPEDYGAVGNGTTDDTAALNNLKNATLRGEGVYFAPGKVYRFADTLDHYYWNNKDGVTLYGRNSRIHATVPSQSGMQFEGADDVWIEGLTLSTDLSGLPAPGQNGSRGSTTHDQRLTFWNCPNATLIDVAIEGSFAGGIYLWRADNFEMIRPSVANTRADGIHITGPCINGRVMNWRARHIGDDMVAVISYAADGGPCENIVVAGGDGAGQYHGRGITCVGGKNVKYLNNRVSYSRAAGAYIFVESGDYVTTAVQDVTFAGNEFRACPQLGHTEGHPTILIGNWRAGIACDNIEFVYNRIVDCPGPAIPMRLEGSATATITNVRAYGNEILGSFNPGTYDGWINRTDTAVAWPAITGTGASHTQTNIPSNRVRAY